MTGGPDILPVEQGTLRVSLLPASAQKGDVPRLIRKGAVGHPVAVLPNTGLALGPGDLLAFPNGTQCAEGGPVSGTVTFLRIRGLTSDLEARTLHQADPQMTEQELHTSQRHGGRLWAALVPHPMGPKEAAGGYLATGTRLDPLPIRSKISCCPAKP